MKRTVSGKCPGSLLSVFTVLLLLCLVFLVSACADGYENVSDIPGAVDFSVSVEIVKGQPRIVTDYPFKETGASEMHLVYVSGLREVLTLKYRYPSGESSIESYSQTVFPTKSRNDMIAAIENKTYGDFEYVYINTRRGAQRTNWVLTYCNSWKQYIAYEEKTNSRSFDSMDAGGISRSAKYRCGKMVSQEIHVKHKTADLYITHNTLGEFTRADILRYRDPILQGYIYNFETGLFGDLTLKELGFSEKEFNTPALFTASSANTAATVFPDSYASLSDIPMAVPFSVSVSYKEGYPQIVTDYPFEETGATQLHLVYSKDGTGNVVLGYRYPSSVAILESHPASLSEKYTEPQILKALQKGEFGRLDRVYVSTSHFNAKDTDWVLEYSPSKKQYLSYRESTNLRSYNDVAYGNVSREIFFNGKSIDQQRVSIRHENAHMEIGYDLQGVREYAYISQYSPTSGLYNYNSSTGLFGDYPITEFGFTDEEFAIPALYTRSSDQ